MEDLKPEIIPAKDFRSLFPEDVYELIIQISRQGFALTLVGGAVRDYFLNGKLSKDLDFELRHSFEYDQEKWTELVKRLGTTLSNKHSYSVEFLPFNILKIKQGHYELEISTPRKEAYTGEGPFGHSDFEVELNPALEYQESFLRRDFTVNAMGIIFGAPGAKDEFTLVDPYNGKKDLKAKVLRPCSEAFYLDPVRFLRTLRFQDRFGFGFEGDLSKFDLSLLTKHYFFQECLHNFFPLVKAFFKAVSLAKVSLNSSLHELLFLRDVDLGNLGELTRTEVLILLTFNKVNISLKDREAFVKYSGLKSGQASDYDRFRDLLFKLKHINDQRLVRRLRTKNFIELLDDEDLVHLKALHSIYNKQRFKQIEILGKVNEEAFTLYSYFNNLFGDETKGKTVAAKLMKLVPQNEKRAVITMYCHLLVHFNLRPVLPESRFGS
ncbi:MAG: hypothetical protein ACJAT2_002651 [Bacteriovoracaceae bacterium]|jgi:hypothetical protein